MQHIIIGAGPAGVIAAETLRKADADADITIIGDEPEPPYSRMAIPYHLIGNIDEAGTYLRDPKQHFQSLNIEVVQQRVDRIDASGKNVNLADGSSRAWDKLLIATGRPLMPIHTHRRGPRLAGPHLALTPTTQKSHDPSQRSQSPESVDRRV